MLTDLDLLSARYDNAIKEQSNELVGVLASIKSRADPVNLSTGNFVYDHEDLKIGGDISMNFHRYYNSLDRVQSSLGRYFVHNYDIKLEFDGRKKAAIRMHDGQRKNFILKENGIYTGLGSAKESFYSEEDRYVLQDMSGYRWIFDNKGRLLREENRHKRGISFTYYEEEDKLLKKAEADNGTSLRYTYKGTLTCVEDNEKRQVLLNMQESI